MDVTIAQTTEEEPDQQQSQTSLSKSKSPLRGKVIRCAARSYHQETSKPSSNRYTTRKNEYPLLHVNPQGVTGDYNHYRTVALNSTHNRAISILTTDVMDILKAYNYEEVQNGDLGENILVEGLSYDYFKIGEQYELGKNLLVEITERIAPCANLCKLKFINQDDLSPKERINRCVDFVNRLDDVDGKRGWQDRKSVV